MEAAFVNLCLYRRRLPRGLEITRLGLQVLTLLIWFVWLKPLVSLSPEVKFGQLQDVDLQSIEPSIRADTKEDNLRDDLPETFENREAIIAALPSYEEPYIKVPKVLNKE